MSWLYRMIAIIAEAGSPSRMTQNSLHDQYKPGA